MNSGHAVNEQPASLRIEAQSPKLRAEVDPSGSGLIKIGNVFYKVTVESQGQRSLHITKEQLIQLSTMAVAIINDSGMDLSKFSPTKITTSDRGVSKLLGTSKIPTEPKKFSKEITGSARGHARHINQIVKSIFEKAEREGRRPEGRRKGRRPEGRRKGRRRPVRKSDEEPLISQQQQAQQQQGNNSDSE